MFGKGMSSIPLTIIPLPIRWFGERLLKHLASQSGDKSTALQTLRDRPGANPCCRSPVKAMGPVFAVAPEYSPQ